MLASFLSGEFLLHILSWLFFFFFYLGSFPHTSRAGFSFMWGVSLTHPVLVSFFIWGVSLTHPLLVLLFIGGVSLTHPVLASFLCGEFLLHIPCWLHFYLGSFSYTSHAGFIFIWGVSLTHPMLVSSSSFFLLFFYVEFLLHIPCKFVLFFSSGFFFFNLGSFSNTSRAAFVSLWVASLVCILLWRQPLKKRAGWKMAQKKRKKVKKSHSKQRRNPTTPYTKQNKTKQELSDKWPQKRMGNKRNGS